MNPQNRNGLLPLIAIAYTLMGCTHPVYKSMDIASYNQNTRQWKVDYNLFPLNPNWQYKLAMRTAPLTKNQCPLYSNDPAEWKKSPSCTSQDIHFNGSGYGCSYKDSVVTYYDSSGQKHQDIVSVLGGGHMNWFPITCVGILNFEDHSDKWTDDDYNFYLQTPDSSFYLGGDDPAPTNQFMALEFDSDEFPDQVDDDYDIWWNHFHDAVDNGDHFYGSDYSEAKAKVRNKLTIATGMAGVDIGHPYTNTWTSELHPVFGMFILTDEQTLYNADGTLEMIDTWSFFLRNQGNEGWCGTRNENAGRKQLNVFIPEMPYYYAGEQSHYPADASDHVIVYDGNVHITNWNGITDNNDLRRERWTKQLVNGGVILNFNFDSNNSDGIFVGDIKMDWNIHISIGGFGNLRKVNKFMDESKFKENHSAIYNTRETVKREYETIDDSLFAQRVGKLNNDERQELKQALAGKTVIPGMPALEQIPKRKNINMRATEAGKDSINVKQFDAQVKKMKIQTMPAINTKVPPSASLNTNLYAERKMSRRAFIDAYLKSKHI